MKTIHVNASSEYPVIVGNKLLPLLGEYIKKYCSSEKIAIISDSNVWPLYGDVVCSSLKKAGYDSIISYVVPAGEPSKSGSTYLAVLEFLAQNQITRSDCVIALGGGVVGDLTGFVAATYLRGIDFIQIPTTLLAAVDSSVGGKTAIDLVAGKNLVGSFYQPRFVLCDTDTLDTLPVDVFRDGCAEVIKYSILYDAELFEHLKVSGIAFSREDVIARCVELKRNVVAEDEFDRGQRQMLNLGHTIGHGIEAMSNFMIPHGQAVATGMAIVSRAAAALNILDCDICNEIIDLLKRFDLPVHTDYTAQDLYSFTLSDKKRSGATVNLIVPQDIGSCFIRPTSIDELETFIQTGL